VRYMLEAVIFDMDGVLIDTEKFYMRSEQQIVAKYGIDVPASHFTKYCGTTQDYIWQNIKDEFNLPASLEQLKEIAPIYLEKLFDTEGVTMIDGIPELLAELSASPLKLAVASSTKQALIHKHLSSIGLSDYFDVMESAENVKHSKPAPDVFLKTAELLGVNPENCLVIEDSSNGVKAAKNAGMVCIAFKNPEFPSQDTRLADLEVTRIEDITLARCYQLYDQTVSGK